MCDSPNRTVISNSSGKRIANNTIILYIRMAIVMIVNLYSVRLVLNALGSTDYGIYDVVAGIVTMFGSVSSVLSIATQRFFSFSIGKGSNDEVKVVYSSSITVFAVLSLLIILLSETLGLWFLNTHLNIPDDRMLSANWVYHFSIFSFIFLIFQTPFSSAVLAYEDMGAYAIISMAECFLRFGIALYLGYTGYDKLIIYGLLLMIISIISLLSYICIVKHRYKECKYKISYSTEWKGILTFSGWALYGTIANVGISQVCTLLVNIFFGPVVNAARAIATQMSGVIHSFSNSFLMAVRPPIIKSYAEKEFDKLNLLFQFSNKFTYYILLILFIPLFSEMEFVLKLWLKVDESQTVLFSRLMLVYAILMALSNPITFVMHATGKVKQYHTLVEIPTLLVVPVTYILYLLGLPAYVTYITLICAIVVSHVIRIACINHYYEEFQMNDYLKSFVLRALIVTFICVTLYSVVMSSVTLFGMKSFIFACFLSVILAFPLIYYIGMTKIERKSILGYIQIIFKQNVKKRNDKH